VAGFGGQIGLCHRHGSGSDESSLSAPLAEYFSLHHCRGSNYLHGYWTGISLYGFTYIKYLTTAFKVIGTAIAINILIPQIPLVGGCALAMADTLFILLFYAPDGSLRKLRIFELFVSAFVLGVFISFCIELSLISAPVGGVFRGYLPSAGIFQGQG
jgi:metal iron transporter